jgi:nucleotide-binding universal stress UspA family protein
MEGTMFKTIVVHVSPTPGMPATFATAASLALTHGAHLVGTAVSGLAETSSMMATAAAASVMPAFDLDALRNDAQQHLDAFQRQCEAAGVASCETRLLDTSAATALLLQSRYCDLIVAGSQDAAQDPPPVPARLPGHLVTQCVRPVLLVPPLHQARDQFSKVMIAWNGSAGASRALAFAMPLLQRAAQLTIVVCNPLREGIDVGAEPGADLATYLARHHRNVQVVSLDTVQRTSTALCELAQRQRFDLVVAGAYGHSRLHDWVVGSTTGELIERCPVPLLMTR